MSATVAIPFEKQRDDPSQRTCGAAALCMVYRSFDRADTQDDIWQRLAPKKVGAATSLRTYRLCQDALTLGLSGMIVQARDPWRILQRCGADPAVRVILNQRLTPQSSAGHFSVLVEVGIAHVLVHDPQLGPGQRRGQDEFLELWRPGWGRSEITGHVLVALTMLPPGPAACAVCGAAFPFTLTCDDCHQDFPLQPASILGCIDATCPERTWRRLYCPHCDKDVTVIAPRADRVVPATNSTGIMEISAIPAPVKEPALMNADKPQPPKEPTDPRKTFRFVPEPKGTDSKTLAKALLQELGLLKAPGSASDITREAWEDWE